MMTMKITTAKNSWEMTMKMKLWIMVSKTQWTEKKHLDQLKESSKNLKMSSWMQTMTKMKMINTLIQDSSKLDSPAIVAQISIPTPICKLPPRAQI